MLKQDRLMVLLPVLTGPCIIVWQIYNWLKFGEWVPVEVRDLFFRFDSAQTNWLGVNKIINYFFSSPASVFCIVVGFLYVFVLSLSVRNLWDDK